jgi:hypothetical protein
MNSKFRPVFLAVAFSVTVAAAITGATLRGETKESVVTAVTDCAEAAWPAIPAGCIKGGDGREVRMIGADVDAFDAEEDAEAQDDQADAAIDFATDFN